MFKKNPNEGQISIFDPCLKFPQYVLEALSKTWAPYFYNYIFNNIDEERFAVLFSENYSRPNTPVNIIVGLLFLKELNGWTDEEMIGALYFDYRVQYALGITDFQKERLCINTISNFRGRLYEYSLNQDIDLLAEEVHNLTGALIDLTAMDTTKARQDSYMISANCKKMGRLELIYTTNANMVKELAKLDENLIPEACRHYREENDKAKHIYRLKKEAAGEKVEQLVAESLELYNNTPENLYETQAYLNLARLLSEQTKQTEAGVFPKANSELSASSMQNPSEPDATYRKKGDKKHTGYVANTIEARDEEKNLSMIIHYEQQPNTTSDSELGCNALDADLNGVKVIANDGAYYSAEAVDKAEERDIEMGFSALTGKKTDEEKLGVNEFELDENNCISACPAGFAPESSAYNEENETYTAKFSKEQCDQCSLREHCPVKEQKKSNRVSFTNKTRQADICRARMGEPYYQALAAFRAGVEGVPSVLRRRYEVDNIPVRGLNRSRIWQICKVMAYNFKSFFDYSKRKAKEETASAFLSLFCRPIFGITSLSSPRHAGCS